MAPFAYCRQGLVPVLLVGHSGATLALDWVSSGICQCCGHIRLQGGLPVLCSERLSLVGRACSRPDVAPSSETGVLVIFLSPQGRHYFGEVLPLMELLAHCQAYDTAFDGLLSKVGFMGIDCRRTREQNMQCNQGLHQSAAGADLQLFWRTPAKDRLEWMG